jgi:hypothetical protein
LNDLEVKVQQQPGKIICNFKEIKEALEIQMTAYTSLEITEEGQKEAKADLATLRKIRKAVDDQRKAVKNEFMTPYNEFEKEVKDILAVIDTPITMIDTKLKEFDERRIEEKQQHLHELYEEAVGEYADYLPYHMLASPKWNNATCKDSDIRFTISEAVLKVKTDISTIKMLGSEIEDKLLEAYKESGNNLQAAIQKHNDYNEAKKLAEIKVKAEAELEPHFEQGLTTAPPIDPVITFTDIKDASTVLNDRTTHSADTAIFVITGETNIQTVRDFLNLSNIEYEES